MGVEIKGKVVFIDGKCEGKAEGGVGQVIEKITKAMSDPEVKGIVAAVRCCAAGGKAGCSRAKGESGGADARGGADKNGPSLVNSDEYRDGWERIFGGRKVAKKDLN
jgi:hypothetical protein